MTDTEISEAPAEESGALTRKFDSLIWPGRPSLRSLA